MKLIKRLKGGGATYRTEFCFDESRYGYFDTYEFDMTEAEYLHYKLVRFRYNCFVFFFFPFLGEYSRPADYMGTELESLVCGGEKQRYRKVSTEKVTNNDD